MDDDALSKGFAFHLTGLLQRTCLTEPGNQESIFASHLDGLDFHDGKQSDALDICLLDDLNIAPIELIDAPLPEDTESASSEEGCTSPADADTPSQEKEDPLDIWTLETDADGQVAPPPSLQTWEAFEKCDPPTSAPSYLSESSPGICNTALRRLEPSNPNTGLLPQSTLLRPLCSLIIGKSSVFFQWTASKQAFEPILPDVPMVGYSMTCQRSFLETMMKCGSLFRHLLEYGSMNVTKRSCPALVALKASIISILNQVEKRIVTAEPTMRSMLQLQALVRQPHELLQLLSILVRSVEGHSTDEAVISAISDEITQIVGSDHTYAALLQEIMARVSGPWLQRLCNELQMNGSRAAPATFLQEQNSQDGEQDLKSSFGQTDDAEDFPSFVQEHDRTLIHEMRSSLKVLRRGLPSDQHSMSQTDAAAVEPESVSVDTKAVGDGEIYALKPSGDTSSIPVEQLAWTTDDAQYYYLSALSDRMSQLPVSSPLDGLESLVLSTLCRVSGDFGVNDLETSLLRDKSCDPLDHIRALMISHVSRVNKAMVRCVFQQHEMLRHLTALQQFFLFGNGTFVERLTTALFSKEVQTAHFARGNIPSARTLGLRLGIGTEQRWPPASSEVQLSLMGILADTHTSTAREAAGKRATDDLPGGLSFSIRELSETEIDKVTDPHSIYALDFLKLQYTAPAALADIFTPTCLKAYDDAFRFLLRLLRTHNVTTVLQRSNCLRRYNSPSDGNPPSMTAIRLTAQAHHVTSVLMSYCLDVGIGAPWTKLLQSMKGIEKSVASRDNGANDESSNLGLDDLRRLHETFLSSMRSRLFLRRKQSKIQDGVEGVITAILNGAVALRKNDSGGVNDTEKELQRRVQDLIILLQTAADRSMKDGSLDEKAEEDMEAVRILQSRIDFNDFYKQPENRE